MDLNALSDTELMKLLHDVQNLIAFRFQQKHYSENKNDVKDTTNKEPINKKSRSKLDRPLRSKKASDIPMGDSQHDPPRNRQQLDLELDEIVAKREQIYVLKKLNS